MFCQNSYKYYKIIHIHKVKLFLNFTGISFDYSCTFKCLKLVFVTYQILHKKMSL